MSLKKFLAVILCIAAVLSVMTVMAVTTQASRIEAADDAPFPSTEPSTTPSTDPTSTRNVIEWGQDAWETVKNIYNKGFDIVTKILLGAFNFLIWITGGLSFMRPK